MKGRLTEGPEPVPAALDPGEDGPKRWELRAVWRAFERSKDGRNRRNPAQQMIDAAWGLVEEHDDITVKQVVERAGVALQTFYRHFGSKDELVLAMMEESIGSGSRMLAELTSGEPPRERLRLLIEYAIVGVDRDPAAEAIRRKRLQWSARERQRLSQRFPLEVEAVHEAYRTAVLTTLEDARAAGVASPGDAVLTASVIQHLVLSMTHVVASGGVDATPMEVAEAVFALCWEGVGTPGA